MADVHDQATRSYNMIKIKGANTKPEMLVRTWLHANGFRYRLHRKDLPGKPDLTLSKYRTVLFVNGCFWHGHEDCRYFVLPKTRTDWWKNKIENTVKRDQKALNDLNALGWYSLIVWECELKKDKRDVTLHNLLSEIIMNKK